MGNACPCSFDNETDRAVIEGLINTELKDAAKAQLNEDKTDEELMRQIDINMDLEHQLLAQRKAYHKLKVDSQHEQKKRAKAWQTQQIKQQQAMLALTQRNQELQQQVQNMCKSRSVSQSASDSVDRDFVCVN